MRLRCVSLHLCKTLVLHLFKIQNILYNKTMNFDKLFDKTYDYRLRSEDIEPLKNYLQKKKGWVYIATTEDHAHFKIGRTAKTPSIRAKTLSTAGVFNDYEMVFALDFFNAVIAERNVHKALAKYRLSNHKEFFQASQELVVKAVEQEYQKEKLLLARFFQTEPVREDLEVLSHYTVKTPGLKK